MPQKYFKFIFPAVIILIGLIVGFLNFTPHTYLTGWDTLHPEFDYSLNLQRTIFGVFRSEQGLGAVAAHSHMSEIPRILMLAVMDIFLPTNVIRYAYILLTLIVGPLGIFYFLKTCLKKEFENFKFIDFSAFLAAVFYMLNLGTLQQFVVPFEMFNALYGFLPWIMLYAVKYIYSQHNEQKKLLLLFFIFSLLASPMAYAPALWYVYFLMLGLFLLILSLPKLFKKDFSAIKKSAVLILITLLVNSYWLLPHLYFLINNSSEVSQALVNKLFSEEAFYYNKEYGNIKQLALLKSFLFSWSIYGGPNGYLDLLGPWIQHLKSIPVLITGYSLSIFALIGLIYSIIKKKTIFVSLFVMLVLTLFFLFNNNPPVGFLFTFIQEKIPLFKEALRFPHTKFFIHYIFIFSVFFGIGILFITNKISKFSKPMTYIFIALIPLLIFYFMLPAFRGNYISPQMRISIPSDYFELSKYMNASPSEGKVAILPINSFWGWDYNDWGYQGAGFIWFNIKQPVLHRNFDRWSKTNEQFYKEMSYAIYSRDPQKLENVIKKYDISFLLIDRSLISPDTDPKSLFTAETQDLLKKQTILKKTRTFGKLDLYELRSDKKDLVYSISNPVSVEPSTNVLYEDPAYKEFGNYVSDSQPSSITFPFRNLINNESEIYNNLYQVTDEGIKFPLNSSISNNASSVNDKLVYADILVRKNPNSSRTLIVAPINNSASSQSGTMEIPIQNSNETLVNINESSTFNVPVNLDAGTTLLLGRTRFQTDSNNSISFYNPNQSEKSSIKFTSNNFLLRQCDNTQNIDNFGIDFLSNNSFSIFGKNIPLCLTMPLSEVLDSKGSSGSFLFGIKYNSEINNTNAPSSICVVNLKNGNCMSYFTTDFSASKRNSYYYGLKSQNIGNIGLLFFLDTTKNVAPTKATFENLEISQISPYASVNISGKDIKELLPSTGSSSELLTYFSGDQRLSQDITKLPKTIGKCEINPKYSIKDKKKSIEVMDDYIRYTTDDGSLCDSFSYQNLIQNQSYIMLVTSRNLGGLPLSICLTNFYSKKCDIYTRLTHNKEFTTQAFLLPPMGNSDNGYDVNTNNFAVKGTTSINDLKSITFVPFPYQTAMNLSTNNNTEGTTSSVNEVEYKSLNPLLYKTSVPNSGEYLSLSFTYDKGWQAYAFKNDNPISNLINYSLPFITGNRLDKKVLVDNWSNGWKIDKSGNYILIVYLPQYLEYLGLALTTGTLLILIIISFKERKSRRPKN